MHRVNPDRVTWCYNERKWLIFPVIDNIQSSVWISNNTLTWAASHLPVPEHCISATCWQVSPEILLGCTHRELMSGDNYFRQPSGLVVRGSDVSLGPERKLCPCIRCFTCALRFKHKCSLLEDCKTSAFWGISGNVFRFTSHWQIWSKKRRTSRSRLQRLSPHVWGDLITIWKKSHWLSKSPIHGLYTPMNDQAYAVQNNMLMQKQWLFEGWMLIINSH